MVLAFTKNPVKISVFPINPPWICGGVTLIPAKILVAALNPPLTLMPYAWVAVALPMDGGPPTSRVTALPIVEVAEKVYVGAEITTALWVLMLPVAKPTVLARLKLTSEASAPAVSVVWEGPVIVKSVGEPPVQATGVRERVPVTVEVAARKYPVTPRFVAVAFEKIPVEALVAPMVVPLMVPPEMVTFEVLIFKALRVVPDAVAKLNHPVEVTLKAMAVVPLAVVKPSQVEVEPVKLPLVAKKVVAVAFVNTPVEALVAPMVVPLMVPPEMVTLEDVRLITFSVVPLAVV